uniref:kinesin-like protein KIFC1 n=1 Tax=Euleptes europaea TaxID=460621 RepID=UPI002540BC32|nr:kinesin-like protein KIFC1 [Euleptes europaea]
MGRAGAAPVGRPPPPRSVGDAPPPRPRPPPPGLGAARRRRGRGARARGSGAAIGRPWAWGAGPAPGRRPADWPRSRRDAARHWLSPGRAPLADGKAAFESLGRYRGREGGGEHRPFGGWLRKGAMEGGPLLGSSVRQLPLTEQKANMDGGRLSLLTAASRLPVPGLRPKRPATSENEPPRESWKCARVSLAPPKRGATSVAVSQPKEAPAAAAALRSRRGPGRRSTIRAGRATGVASTTVLSRRPVPAAAAAAPTSAARAPAAAGGGEKKRAPWDLKGQVSDLRAKVGALKEKAQGLDSENRGLKQQVAGLEQELQRVAAENGELGCRASSLALELQVWQDRAKESLQKLSELSAREQQLEETVRSQNQTIGELEGAKKELEEAQQVLAAQLSTMAAQLRLAEEALAQQRQENEALQARMAEQDRRLHDSEMERRSLHNMVQELKGNIRVFCRVRPLLPWEKEAQKGMGHLRFPPDDNRTLVLSKAEESHVGRERKDDITYEFNFDRVFPPLSLQEDVFEEIALLVQSALDGYNVCIFAYGQTGSGKTYTMEGPEDLAPTTAGMIPRAVQQIFRASRQMEAKGWKYQFTANFLEIYNESLRDLLVLRPERSSELEIKRVNQSTEELHVPNLSYVPVASEGEVLKLLQMAKANRSVAKTTLNERSSRSHSLFQLHIEGQHANRDVHTSSVLNLVDLAGSERLDKSLSKGERLKETQAINSSLSNLGLVIMALSNKEAHVPYRNSKLTYLLQNSLGGSSKMLMFVNISPLEENFAESLNSLRFARKVNECIIGTAQTHRK